MIASSKVSIAGIAALCILLFAILYIDRGPIVNRAFLIDFRAFYCAGSVHAAGENPYHVEPLRSCEHRTVAVPAPLPGYDLALFSLFTELPFDAAAAIWESILAISFCATVFALTRLTGLEPFVVFGSLLFSDAVASMFLGQLVPSAIAAFSIAMLCISHKQYRVAALCTALSLIEPHIGLGACLGLFLFAPQCRVTLFGAVVCLVSISVASHTLGNDLEYVRDVIPAHILSEINNEDQYSLTHLLTLLGMQEHIAVAFGSLSYAAFLTLSLIAAKALCKNPENRAFLIALPPAFTLIGGPFVHIHQMAAALPAALLLFARFPTYRCPMGIAVFLLAVPWNNIFLLAHLGPVLAITTLFLSARLLQASLPAQAAISIAITAVVFIAVHALAHATVHFPATTSSNPHASAEGPWRTYIDGRHSDNQTLFLLLKLPTWTALLLTVGIAFRAGIKKRGLHAADNETLRETDTRERGYRDQIP